MSRYASALSRHPVAATAVGETAGEILDAFADEPVDLLVVFVSAHFAGAVDDMVGALRDVVQPEVLLGCSAAAVIGDASEVEDEPGLALFAARFPEGSRLTPVQLQVVDTPDGSTVTGWPELDHEPTTLLVLADPFSFPVEQFLRRLDDDRPELQVMGGLASAANRPGANRLIVDETVASGGAVGVFLEGCAVRTVVSQGCRPIGQPFVVTRSERNFVEELGGRSALDRVREIAADASDEDRQLLHRGLHVGLVVDESRVEFERGDFLIRNVLGADQRTGAVAVDAVVNIGQTVQFQVRDAAAADEDLRELLVGHHAEGALLFTCNGRGQHLFGAPSHDAGVLAELLGPLPVAGMFCAGEIGPVGGRSFLHGFTASLVLFEPDDD